MLEFLQFAALVLVAIATVPAAAHALELPGKMRLDREAYLAVQPIYYPGFTIAGFAEPLALIASAALVVLTPRGTADFRLAAVALALLLTMHAVYWLFTHPVNNFWLKGQKVGTAGTGFFGIAGSRGDDSVRGVSWIALRDRWERSHVARAALAFLAFLALAVVMTGEAPAL
jgi:hypothetical protein